MESRKSFLLRMSPSLYRELEAWAQQEMRSVNGQIEFLLTDAVKKRKGSENAIEEASAMRPAMSSITNHERREEHESDRPA